MRAGDRIEDRWEIDAMAGAGGMSEVYRAHDLVSGEKVAVKLMHAVNDEVSARFERECRLLSELSHPSILRYLAHGQLDRDLFLVTEWLDGEDLSHRLRRQRLTLAESLEIVERVAEALAPAHDRGIVHRDVKPPNVFLVERDLRRVKLLDFGIARLPRRSSDITSPGMTLGTPSYMSPEQASGQRAIDVRADVWALGCVLFKLISGRTPYTGADAIAMLAKKVLEDAPRLSSVTAGVPPEVDTLVARLLSRSPESRPADAAAAADEIRALRQASLTTAADSGEIGLGTEERRLVSLVLVRRAMLPASFPSAPFEDAEESTIVEPMGELDIFDDEATRATGDPRQRMLRRIARRHGAHMQGLADGSVVLIVAGGDVATDLAARAARLALELAENVPQRTISLGTGMSASGDITTVGDVIDRASIALARAGDLAPDESTRIVVDDVSAALIEHRFVIERAGGAMLLTRRREDVEAPRRLLGRPAAFVGREREIEMLANAFGASVEGRLAHTVIVTGAPGVGKTRLMQELVERIGGEPERLEAAGDPMRAGSPFSLIAHALRRRFGVHSGDPRPAQHARLATVVSDMMAGEDRDRVVMFLAELMGAPFPDDHDPQLTAARQSPLLMGDQMRRAWDDYLLAVTETRPVLIVIDDLQWADVPSVKLLESALAALRHAPLMMIAFARPEARALFPTFSNAPRFAELGLTPLSMDACERIVAQTLKGLATPAETAHLVSHAEGNPFFLEELLRVMVEGRLSALPDTVLATLEARIFGLEADARRVLRAASILGTTFWTSGVHSMLGKIDEVRTIDAWLDYLADQEWLVKRSTSSVRGEIEWAFRQTFACDAAYATLTEEDRERGHRLAAEWLEAHHSEDAIVVAEHFERGGEGARAAPHFARAARQSLEGDDIDGALARSVKGLASVALSDDASLRQPFGMLHLVRAETHRWRGESAAAASAAQTALKLLAPKTAPWFLALAESLRAHDRLDADDAMRDAAASFDDPPSDPEVLDAYCTAAACVISALARRGDHRRAGAVLGAAERALARHETHGPRARASVASARSAEARAAGRASAALAWAKLAVDELDRLGDRRSACVERANVGSAEAALGRYADAEASLRSALETALALGLEDGLALLRQRLGLVLSRAGRSDEAVALLRSAAELFAKQQSRTMHGWTRHYLGHALQRAGDLPAAEIESRAAAELFSGRPAMRCAALARLASILRAKNDRDAANGAALVAMAALNEAGGTPEGHTHVRLEHALALRDLGHAAESAREIAALRAQLVASAKEIEDPGIADAYLHEIEEHARILALADDR